MADPDILGVPRNQVQLTEDPDLLTADEIAALSQPEIDAALAAAPPEFRAELERAIAGRRAQMATEALIPDPRIQSATSALPGRPQLQAPVAAATPEQLAAPADQSPHTDYMRGVLAGDSGLRADLQGGQNPYGVQPGGRGASQVFPVQNLPESPAAGPQAQAVAAAPAEKPMSAQEELLLNIILQYQARFPEWDGSPGTAPDSTAKHAAEEANRLELERQGKLAETHGGELAQATKDIADATGQAALRAQEYADEANRAQNDRDVRAQGYEAAIRRAQSDLERESESVDPNRILHGGRGVLIAIASGLGAFGAAMTKTPNFAQHIIDEALDRDFQMQKDRVGIKQGQVSKAQEIYNSFRLKGMEQAAAKAATYGVIQDYYAKHIQKLVIQKQSIQERQAGETVQSSLQGQAEFNKNNAIIQESAGKPAVPAHDILKEALERQKQMVEIARIQAETQKAQAEAGEVGKPKPPSEAIREKLATQLATQTTTLNNINEMLGMLRTGKVGPISAKLPLTAEHQRFDVLRQQAIEGLARSFGAATTDSDRKAAAGIEQGRFWNILTTPQMIDRLEALQASAIARQKNVLAGQDPAIIKQIQDQLAAQQANEPAPAPTLEDYANKFGGHL